MKTPEAILAEYWCGPRPKGSLSGGCDEQIHMDYKVLWRKRVGMAALKVRERTLTPAWAGFYCFSGYITWRKVLIYYAQFPIGDYLLQKTKERMLLTTSNIRRFQINRESGETGYTPYLGGLKQIFRSDFKNMQWPFAASIQSEGVLAKASLRAAYVQGRPNSPQQNLSVGMTPVSRFPPYWIVLHGLGYIPHVTRTGALYYPNSFSYDSSRSQKACYLLVSYITLEK